jgi:hypothetical protein
MVGPARACAGLCKAPRPAQALAELFDRAVELVERDAPVPSHRPLRRGTRSNRRSTPSTLACGLQAAARLAVAVVIPRAAPRTDAGGVAWSSSSIAVNGKVTVRSYAIAHLSGKHRFAPAAHIQIEHAASQHERHAEETRDGGSAPCHSARRIALRRGSSAGRLTIRADQAMPRGSSPCRSKAYGARCPVPNSHEATRPIPRLRVHVGRSGQSGDTPASGRARGKLVRLRLSCDHGATAGKSHAPATLRCAHAGPRGHACFGGLGRTQPAGEHDLHLANLVRSWHVRSHASARRCLLMG